MRNNIASLKKIPKKIKIKKKSKFIEGNLIQYSKSKYDVDFLKLMKNGYLEMASINLEISESTIEGENTDLDKYENWLCGV